MTDKNQKTNLETAFKVLDGIQDQIKFADAKAGFIVALMTIQFGFAAEKVNSINIENAKRYLLLIASVYMILSLTAVIIAIWTVWSRLGGDAPQTKVFFGHIFKVYGRDYKRYVSEMKESTDSTWLEEIGAQIVEVSHVAKTKHDLIRKSSGAAILSVLLWALLVVLVKS